MKLTSAIYSILTAAIAVTLFAGCASDRSVLGHRPTLSGQTRLDLTPATDISGWRASYYASGASEADRKFYRNEIVRRLMRLDDEAFNAWSQKLYGTRAISGAAGDFATGLMGAFAATSGAAAAQTLGLAIAGVSGARSAAEKDLFLEKSAGALISKMKGDRAKVDAQITQYLEKNTSKYPLEQGVRDIIRYYEAGTLASAAETLQSDAKVSQLAAQGQVESIKGDRIIAPVQMKQAQAQTVIEPQLPMRTKETIITDADLDLSAGEAAGIEKERARLAALLRETNNVVNATRDAIETKDPPKRIDYGSLMDGADPNKEYTRTQNGLSRFLKANSGKPDVLKSVQEAARKQNPILTP